MSYAIITVGGKQYRVSEGDRLLVDRLALEDGATFTPSVLLAGGNGDTKLAPSDVIVTAKVLQQAKGPKIRIGKYKKRTGYKRHTGFRASLTQIQIESIGGSSKRAAAATKPAAAKQEKPEQEATAPIADKPPAGLPKGYDDLTVAEIKEQAGGWNAPALAAALEFEQSHAKRKGAIAALESALAEKED